MEKSRITLSSFFICAYARQAHAQLYLSVLYLTSQELLKALLFLKKPSLFTLINIISQYLNICSLFLKFLFGLPVLNLLRYFDEVLFLKYLSLLKKALTVLRIFCNSSIDNGQSYNTNISGIVILFS